MTSYPRQVDVALWYEKLWHTDVDCMPHWIFERVCSTKDMLEVLYLSRMINTSRYKYVSLKVSQYPTRKMKKYKYSHLEMLIFIKIKPTVQISYDQMTATTSELMSMGLITVVANTNQTVPCIFILKPSMKSIFS